MYSKPKRFLAPTAFEAVPARLSGLLSMKLMRGSWRLNPRQPYSSWLVLALDVIGKYFSGSSVVAASPAKLSSAGVASEGNADSRTALEARFRDSVQVRVLHAGGHHT